MAVFFHTIAPSFNLNLSQVNVLCTLAFEKKLHHPKTSYQSLPPYHIFFFAVLKG